MGPIDSIRADPGPFAGSIHSPRRSAARWPAGLPVEADRALEFALRERRRAPRVARNRRGGRRRGRRRHLHVGHAGDARDPHAELQRSILLAHAGTAVSARGRGEANAYNRIRVDPPDLEIEVRAWTGSEFAAARTLRFSRLAGGWRARASE